MRKKPTPICPSCGSASTSGTSKMTICNRCGYRRARSYFTSHPIGEGEQRFSKPASLAEERARPFKTQLEGKDHVSVDSWLKARS